MFPAHSGMIRSAESFLERVSQMVLQETVMVDIQAGIIDQRVRKLAESLEGYPGERAVSAAFVLLCIQTALDLDAPDARDCLVDGDGDAGIDGLFLGPERDGEPAITIFQGKYSRKLDGASNFPETAIVRVIHTISSIFDPGKRLDVNPSLAPRLEGFGR